jgi:hypothetical protein
VCRECDWRYRAACAGSRIPPTTGVDRAPPSFSHPETSIPPRSNDEHTGARSRCTERDCPTAQEIIALVRVLSEPNAVRAAIADRRTCAIGVTAMIGPTSSESSGPHRREVCTFAPWIFQYDVSYIRCLPYALLVALRLLFRNPEFGHELGTKFAEGSVTSSGSEIVAATGSGGSALHRTSMIVRAAPPTRNRTTLEANVVGDSNSAIRPNNAGHIGMIDVRLSSIDMVVTLLSPLISVSTCVDVSAAGPVHEQPTRVLGDKHSPRLTPPRPSGRPFVATRSRLASHVNTRALQCN